MDTGVLPTGEPAKCQQFEWRATRPLWEVFGIVAVLSGLGCSVGTLLLIQAFRGGFKPGEFAAAVMLWLAGAVFLSLLVLVPTKIMASRDAIRVRGILPFERLVPGDRVVGIVPPLHVKRSGSPDFVHVLLGGRCRPWSINISAPMPSQVRSGLELIFGVCKVHPLLMPTSNQFLAAAEHYHRVGEFRWESRFGWVVSMLGLKALAWAVATAMTWSAYQAWLVHQATISELRLFLFFMLSAGALCLGVLTALDYLRGGPVTAITANADGLTFHRWRNSYRVPAEEVGEIVVLHSGLLTPTDLWMLSAKPEQRRRPLVLRPGHWRGPQGAVPNPPVGMIAPMIFLFDSPVSPVPMPADQDAVLTAS